MLERLSLGRPLYALQSCILKTVIGEVRLERQFAIALLALHLCAALALFYCVLCSVLTCTTALLSPALVSSVQLTRSQAQCQQQQPAVCLHQTHGAL